MLLKPRITMTSFMVVFVFLASAVFTVPALADDTQPPATPEAVVVTEPPVDVPTVDASPNDSQPVPTVDDSLSDAQSVPTLDEAPSSDLQPAPTEDASFSDPQPDPTQVAETTPETQPSETTPPVQESTTTENLLTNVPENTDVVILNQDGESVPLVTQEASDIIKGGDPIWCPATVATPKAGVGGCTNPTDAFGGTNYDPTSLGSLLQYLTAHPPSVDGVIWIEKGPTIINDSSNIVFDGDFLGNMSNYKLTLRGGWNGLGTNTVDTIHPSVFNVSIGIINWHNDVTLSDIVIDGANSTSGLSISTNKNIVLTRVKSNNNTTGNGATLDNSTSTTASAVTINTGEFSGNQYGHGLKITSAGNITLSNITVLNNGTFSGSEHHGAELDNSSKPGATIAITNGNFSGNGLNGLQVLSKGKITLSNITASDNLNSGANVDNSTAVTLLDIVIGGDNTFNTNLDSGLIVTSRGAITLNNILASGNGNNAGDFGAYLKNTYTGAVGAITLTGSNVFTENYDNGLLVEGYGAIKINNITASSNHQSGANLQNTSSVTPQAVTLTGTNRFEDNGLYGLIIRTNGVITTNNITASINDDTGVSLDNSTGVNTGVTMTGFNTFNNNAHDGLAIASKGLVSLANLTASGNTGGWGVNVDNSTAAPVTMNVTLSGTNYFNGNYSGGLSIHSDGIITIYNANANDNNGNGVTLNNQGATNIQRAVTIVGINTFNGNDGNGLDISSYGIITLTNITASYNGSGAVGGGASLVNTGGIVPVAVNLTGVNAFNNNHEYGLSITSLSAITVYNLTANDNQGGPGALLINKDAPVIASTVVVVGAPSLNHNYGEGLSVQSKGAIVVVNVNAGLSVAAYGVKLDNTFSTNFQPVVVSGTNTFNSNYETGLYIRSYGTISINNITATNNGLTSAGYGADLFNMGGTANSRTVTISGINKFNNNKSGGLFVNTNGVITLSNVTASDNMGNGVGLNNINGLLVYSVTVNGFNTLNHNNGDGLQINSRGVVTISNVTASNNYGSGRGVAIFNDGVGASSPVVIFGTNNFNNNLNNDGLYVSSLGTIYLAGVTANSNGGYGAQLDNTGALLKSITLVGVNTFNLNSSGGLDINTKSAVLTSTTTILNANSNVNGRGIDINNATGDPAKPQVVYLLGKVNISDNYAEGLYVESNGIILVNNITAIGNDTGSAVIPTTIKAGVYLLNINTVPVAPAGITLGGVNLFEDNQLTGLLVQSSGVINVVNLTATNNGVTAGEGDGVRLENKSSLKAVGVTVSGINKFLGNYSIGLFIDAAGPVALSNITASDNMTDGGVYINNKNLGVALPQGVTIAGVNTFNKNDADGLYVNTYGFLTLYSATANLNGHYGVYVVNSEGYIPMNVVMVGVNTFNENVAGGVYVTSIGSIVLYNLNVKDTANGSGAYIHNDRYLYNTSPLKPSVGVIVLAGVNVFTSNHINGLDVGSFGAISLNSINASNNGIVTGHGVLVNNSLSTAMPQVTLTGTNVFNGNKEIGLNINTKGLITVSNLTANHNGSYGAFFDNKNGIAGVTITGFVTTLLNHDSGTVIYSKGAVNLVKVTSDGNVNNGLYIQTASTATLTCGSFTNNELGLYVNSASKLTLKGVIAAGNTTDDIDTSGVTPSSVVVVRTCPLP